MSTWTKFWDMHSGGGKEEDHNIIVIEAPQEEAELIFFNKFGHDPNCVTCTCCGPDYSISEYDSLEEAVAYHKECGHGSDSILVVPASVIHPEWREGKVRRQGYVWLD